MPTRMTDHLTRLAKKVAPRGTGVWLRSVFGPFILGGPITRELPDARGKMALTFDDGPDPEYTPQVLKILDHNSIKACFFLIGREAERFPDLVRTIQEEGHEIGNHSQTHPDCFRDLSYREVVEEIKNCGQAVARITGQAPRFFRPPFGSLTFRILAACRRTGMKPIYWSHDSLDYSSNPLTPLAFVESASPGRIALFHDNRGACPPLLEAVLPALVERGHSFTTLGEVF